MCGICGVYYFADTGLRAETSLLSRMVATMHHRGPDGQGTWISDDGRVGLGHARLSIVDLTDDGAQPMSNETGSVHVTFNGEIYNHAELRAELTRRGHRYRSRTDTEDIVHRFEEVGEDVVLDLDGMFGLAVYDSATGDLLLARDRLGIKPLYYAEIPGGIVFASEAKAILQHPAVRAEVDPEALYHYLTYLVPPAPRTLFRGVQKLPAGHLLRVDRTGRVRVRQYWDALPRQFDTRGVDLDERLEALFADSVRKHMMSDVPVGVLFSGGVDSSLNAAYFRDHTTEPVRTFNVGFEGSTVLRDESAFASEMAGLLGTEHHQVRITERQFIDFITHLPFYQDEPIADPVCIPLYFVTKLARDTGTIVVHVGEGADETFTGYDNYLRFIRWHDRYWRPLSKLPSGALRLAAGIGGLLGPSSGRAAKITDILNRAGRGQELFMSSAVAYYEQEKAGILAPGFRARMRDVDSFDAVRPHYDRLRNSVENPTFLEMLTYVELKQRLPELLLARVDKLGMANSIEARVPFLDYRLVEFALSVPQHYKVHGGVGKAPLKRLAARRIPADRIFRPKSGFGAPIQEWFRSALGERFRALLTRHGDAVGEYLDVSALVARSRGPLPRVNDAFQLWTVFNFVQWFATYVQNDTAGWD
jgi:asparagine synthase (glutamine-hydrolysing)